MFVEVLFTIAKTWKQPKCPSVIDWITKTHHGILCSRKKEWDHVLCRDMDEAGSHHSQQANTGTENQTLHVINPKWMLYNENTWTQGGEHHTAGLWGGWGTKEGRSNT